MSPHIELHLTTSSTHTTYSSTK